jgi:hypothetical protein
MHRRHIVNAALSAALLTAIPAGGQDVPGAFRPPIAGEWEPIRSLGQPSPWKPYVGAGVGMDAPFGPRPAGITGTAGVYRDVVNPVLALLGAAGEVYAGQRGEKFDAGARLQLVSPAFHVRGGVDWNARLGRIDAAFGVTVPPTRGGWFGQGGQLRFDWVPARDHAVVAGFELPVGRHVPRRTRPRTVTAPLPVGRAPRHTASASADAAAASSELLASMRWITLLQTFAWRMGDGPLAHDAAVAHSRTSLHNLAGEIAARTPADRGRSVYDMVLAQYHDALAAAFDGAGAAHTADAGDARPAGAVSAVRTAGAVSAVQSSRAAGGLGDEARRIVLEELVLPYNRLVGQYRQPDQLYGLGARARARFLALLLLRELPAADVDATMRVFDEWLRDFERVRAELGRATGDSRLHWLPLALVLRPEEHRTQAQIDALIETGLRRPFTTGNSTRYIDAAQFQDELLRTIHDTRDYHVLWVHDYRGRNEQGEPDRIGYMHTADGYLRALLNGVRTFDTTGRLPVYMIMIDQHSYEEHNARLWLDLLERPLTHEVRLPASHAAMQTTITALQDSLRQAVAASRRLGAHAQALGHEWVEQVVKVHVNITFPSDVSYRAPRVLRMPFAGDNLMRDHRKIVIRDVAETDNGAGEVILTGVGVGERYASPDWDDRAIVLTGPATLEAKHAARAVLEAHGLGGDRLPPPLRPLPYPDDDADRSVAVAGRVAGARVLQVHNRTGFGDKDATFVQMLLYDLAPAGTVIYVPDSLWLSFEHLGQLMQAALRGCHVIIVAPSLANAPNTGFPQLSRMQELVTRAAIIQEQLGDVIRAGGGDFRVGLYTRRAPLDDVAGMIAELEQTLAAEPFVAALFPLSDETLAALRSVRGELDDARAAQPPAAGEDAPHLPMLHRKTHLLASREALAALAAAPGLAAAFTAKLRARAAVGDAVEARDAVPPGHVTDAPPADASAASAADVAADTPSPDSASALLPGLYRAARPAPDRDVLYLTAGTMNMDRRSAMLDGEAMAVVAGAHAAQAFMDFVLLTGGITWVQSVEQAAALLPPKSRLQRWIGRVMHPGL